MCFVLFPGITHAQNLLRYQICSVASQCVMLFLVDTYQSLLHTHSSHFSSELHVSAHCGHLNMWTFKTGYKEHIHAIRNNRPNTGYSRHILDTGHTYGNIDSTMTIIRKARKGTFLNSLEKYYIFLASKQEIHMNEFNVDRSNPT
jgi:hypothetical protein